MNKCGWRRKSPGFTLTEMLVVVVLVIILSSVAIASYASIQRDLTMMELDSAARQIYIAAQNRLTALAAGGSNCKLSGDDGGITDPMHDFDSLAQEWDENFYYLYFDGNTTDPESGQSKLLPTGAMGGLEGNWLVEYNAKSATIYGVFYCRDGFDYDIITSLSSRARYDRMDVPTGVADKTIMLGYYGGGINDRPEQELGAMPRIELINEEELLLTIERNYPEEQSVSVQIIGEISQAEKVYTYSSVTDVNFSSRELNRSNTGSFILVLDSLEEGLHFYQNFTGFIPGENLIITVQVNDATSAASVGELVMNTNSLFATAAPATGDELSDNISIAYGRHLQNLEQTVSAYDMPLALQVSQTRSINWGYYNTKSILFKPIFPTEGLTYRGNPGTVTGLRLATSVRAGGSAFAGLFGQAANITLNGIALIDPQIVDQAQPSTQAGFLVGQIASGTGSRISNCFVISSDGKSSKCRADLSGAASLGGLVGLVSAELDIENSAVSLPLLRIASSGSYVGGLIGRSDSAGLHITGCYANVASLSVGSASYAGGLVGGLNNATILNCYAVGELESRSSSSAHGGLVAAVGTNNTQNPSLRLENCYSAVIFTRTSTTTGTAYYYRLAPRGNTTWNTKNCFYLPTIINGGENDVTYDDVGGKRFYDGLGMVNLGGSWRANIYVTETHPYNNTGKAYPFPAITAAKYDSYLHWGDWPSEDQVEERVIANPETLGVAYYEKYDNGEYGYWIPRQTLPGYGTLAEINNLRDDKIIVATGYALYIDEQLQLDQLTFDGTNLPVPSVRLFNDKSSKLDFYPLDIANRINSATGLLDWTLSYANSFEDAIIDYEPYVLTTRINGYFAKAVAIPAGSLGNPYYVRTGTQLSNVRYALSANFKQERDIYLQRDAVSTNGSAATTGNASFANRPIGDSNNSFTGNYDGGYFRIEQLSLNCTAQYQYVGLFGVTGGTLAAPSELKNIVLLNGSVTGTGTGNYTAPLAGCSQSNISNCAVAYFNVTGASAGGFIGLAETPGTVTNCSACNYGGSGNGGQITGTDKKGYTGAFLAYSENTVITSCYTMATLNCDDNNADLYLSNPGSQGGVDNMIKNCYGGGINIGKNNSVLKLTARGSCTQITLDNGAISQTTITGFNNYFSSSPWGRAPGYPYPAIVKDANGNFVHYGNWYGTGVSPWIAP